MGGQKYCWCARCLQHQTTTKCDVPKARVYLESYVEVQAAEPLLPGPRSAEDNSPPAVDRTLQAIRQLIQENRDQAEAHAEAVQKQVLAVREQGVINEQRAVETKRRNQQLFEQLQRDTLTR